MVTLDHQAFTDRKPTDEDIRFITTRLVQAGPTEIDAAGLWEHVKAGKTFVGGCFGEPKVKKDGKPTWGEFLGEQIFALDFDNKRKTHDAQGKNMGAPLYPGEVGYLSPRAAIARCESMGLEPLFLYQTMSAKPGWPRYRIVFDVGEFVTDEAEAHAMLETLMGLFPECDQGCSNLNRLFFGAGQIHREAGGHV